MYIKLIISRSKSLNSYWHFQPWIFIGNYLWASNTLLATMWWDRLPDPSGSLPSLQYPEKVEIWMDSYIEQIGNISYFYQNWGFDLLLVKWLLIQIVQRNVFDTGKSVTLRWVRAPTTTRMWKIWWDWPHRSHRPGNSLSGTLVNFVFKIGAFLSDVQEKTWSHREMRQRCNLPRQTPCTQFAAGKDFNVNILIAVY